MRQLYAGAAVLSLIACLSACGGSVHAGHAPPPPPTPTEIPEPITAPAASNFDTSEYQASTSAKNSNAIEAWQHGATGKGVKIGFVDTGLYPNNPEFAGRIDAGSGDAVDDRLMADDYGHGTALASIAAAASDGSGIEGIAFDAKIVMIKVDKPGSCNPACDLVNIDKGIRMAADAGANVINLSISGDTEQSVIDAVKDAAKRGVIFVVSAGNDTASQPTNFARAIAAAALGQTIIAGALGREMGSSIDYNQLVTYSNAAGSFSNWYLGAPGYMVNVAYQNGCCNVVSGTSFAAPAVAGAVALLLQAFPNLTPKEVVQILLTTADDLGASGTDTTYGQGRLNIGRAFQPIGQTSLAGSAVAVSIADNGSAPPATGDAVLRGSLEAIVLDAYSRAFKINLARTLRTNSTQRPLEQRIGGDIRSSFTSLGDVGVGLAVANGSVQRRLGFGNDNVGPQRNSRQRVAALSLVAKVGRSSSVAFSVTGSGRGLTRTLRGGKTPGFMLSSDVPLSPGFSVRSSKAFGLRRSFAGFGVSLTRENGQVVEGSPALKPGKYHLNAITLDTRLGRNSLALSTTQLSETDTVLGGRLSSIFGTSRSRSMFLDVELSRKLSSGWTLAANARRGRTSFAAGRLVTSAYSFALRKTGVWRGDDELTLSLSQPLRAESGGMRMELPVTYDYSNNAPTFANSFLGLSPSGREIMGDASYFRRFSFGTAGLSMYFRRQPGHAAAASPDAGGAIQFKINI